MAKTARMEMMPNVMVLLSHDRSLDPILPKGEMIQLDGTMEELIKLKTRDRSAHLLPAQATVLTGKVEREKPVVTPIAVKRRSRWRVSQLLDRVLRS